ncbi:MAG: polysaccharide biosynthesis/export family protein [Pyrinomonadaceae bacterium]
MKKSLSINLLLFLLFALASVAQAQTKEVKALSNSVAPKIGAEDVGRLKTTKKGLVESDDLEKDADKASTSSLYSGAPLQSGDGAAKSVVESPATDSSPVASASPSTPDAKTAPVPPTPSAKTTAPNAASAAPLTEVYLVGVGDVLDIRVIGAASNESTLFTVMPGGLLEYSLISDPVVVSGLTTDEVSALLAKKIKIYDQPKVATTVRQYASHSVIVTGLVSNPGSKFLRREAMPLYVVLAEAMPQQSAGLATIMRTGAQKITVDLSDTKATSALIYPNDVIMIAAVPPAAPQFYFIGGQVGSPGQKDFHAGLTLTQAILASGGAARFANGKVRVSRQGEDGLLTSTEYDLKKIEGGKVPDPLLQPGDRIEVGRKGW